MNKENDTRIRGAGFFVAGLCMLVFAAMFTNSTWNGYILLGLFGAGALTFISGLVAIFRTKQAIKYKVI